MLLRPSSQDHDSSARQLQAESHELRDRFARLETDHQGSIRILEAQRRSLEDEKLILNKKYRAMEVVLQRSRADVKRLNSIVVKSKMEDSGPTDDQIRADFRGLGNAVLKLAHKNLQTTTELKSCHSDDLGKKEASWLQGWSDLTPELRHYRVRGAIFNIVLDAYFVKPYFGLDGRTERALRDFECSLEKNGESTNF